MDLSIIIVNWNTEKLVLGCIKSIFNSEPKTRFEIIVVDNGSNDSSVDSIQHFKMKVKNLKLVRNNINLGYAKACNLGIRVAKGKYILLLNSDTLVYRESIDELMNFAIRRSDCGVVAPKLINQDGSTQPSVYHFPTIRRAVDEFWLGKRGSFQKYSPDVVEPTEVDIVVGAALLITPLAIRNVGLLDERFFMYFEDFDYCRRIKRASLKVYYLPKVRVIHWHGQSGKNIIANKNQWRRLVPSSKIYHGLIKHYLIITVIWLGQKIRKQ